MKKLFSFIYFLSAAMGLTAQEEALPYKPKYTPKEVIFLKKTGPEIESIKNEKVFAFGSFSFASGAGVTYRTRTDGKGRALDLKFGYHPESHGFFGISEMYLPMIDYNFMYFRSGMNGCAPYLSWGIGAVAFIGKSKPIVLPYVPLRFGFEFPNGFVDLGAKMLAGVLPIPEIRAGIGISF